MKEAGLAKTKKEAQDWLEIISELQASMFNKNLKLGALIDRSMTIEEKEKFINFCEERGVKIEKGTQFSNLLTQTAKDLKEAPVITLTLAFNPTVNFLNTLGDWFSKNGISGLVHYRVERDLVGGVIVEYNGAYRDLSLGKKYGKILNVS